MERFGQIGSRASRGSLPIPDKSALAIELLKPADALMRQLALGTCQLEVAFENSAGPSARSHNFLVFESGLAEHGGNADSERMRGKKSDGRVRERS